MFDAICQREVEAPSRLATDSWLLSSVITASSSSSARFYVSSLSAPTVRLGRYHLAPATRDTNVVDGTLVHASRRLSGGRAFPGGPGFIELSIVLSHRGVFLSDDPSSVAPSQIPNRLVRGLLRALRSLGVNAFYPGADLVTVKGRSIAGLAFETLPAGPVLFEVCLADQADFSTLNSWLDAADAGGAVKTSFWANDSVTSIERERGAPVDFHDLVEVLASSYSSEFGIAIEPFQLSSADRAAIESRQPEFGQTWLDQRRVPLDANHYALGSTRIGPLEVFLAVDPGGNIVSALLAGELLANSSAVQTLEMSLIGCRKESAAIHDRVGAAFAGYPNFLLGISPAELTRLISKAT